MATLLEQLPEDWAARGAEQKVQFFNEKNWTPEQLLGAGAGITQADIDWMLQHGYAGKYDAPTGIAGLAPAAPVDYFQAQPDYTYQDLIADTTAAPAAPLPTPQEMATKIGKVLPTEWGVAGGAYDEAQEKGRYFQQQGITSQQLRDAGADPGEIAWLESQGYLGATPQAAATTTTAVADGLPDFSNMVNPFTGETLGSMDVAAATKQIEEDAAREKAVSDLTTQIASQWQQYGINSDIQGINRANELAQILFNYGITDLSKLGIKQTPYEEMRGGFTGSSPESGDYVEELYKGNRGQLTYGDQTFGRLGGFGSGGEKEFAAPQEFLTEAGNGRYGLGYSAAGKGWTDYEVVVRPDGTPVIVPRWGSSSDLTPELVQFLSIAAMPFTGGLSSSLGTALNSQVAGQIASQALISGGLGGLSAASQGGDFLSGFGKGAITGGLTAGVGQFASPFASSVGAEVLAAGAPQWVADAATAAVRAGAGALPQAVISGDFGNVLTSALSAGASAGAVGGVSELTGLSTKDIGAAINFAQGAASGDLSKMLSSAASFTDNPDIEVASKAVRLVQAIESGDPSRIVSAGQTFGKELDGYNTRQTIEKAYQDPTRILDTPTNEDLYNLFSAPKTQTVSALDAPAPQSVEELEAWLHQGSVEAPPVLMAGLPALAPVAAEALTAGAARYLAPAAMRFAANNPQFAAALVQSSNPVAQALAAALGVTALTIPGSTTETAPDTGDEYSRLLVRYPAPTAAPAPTLTQTKSTDVTTLPPFVTTAPRAPNIAALEALLGSIEGSSVDPVTGTIISGQGGDFSGAGADGSWDTTSVRDLQNILNLPPETLDGTKITPTTDLAPGLVTPSPTLDPSSPIVVDPRTGDTIYVGDVMPAPTPTAAPKPPTVAPPVPTTAPSPLTVQGGLSTQQSKVEEYERLRQAGLTDAQIRDAAEKVYGTQRQDDWDYLVGLTRYSPTVAPTPAPTPAPTAAPAPASTTAPTAMPTAIPTAAPAPVPTAAPAPTVAPTAAPTTAPAPAPTAAPTAAPTPTLAPTTAPTGPITPTLAPTITATIAPTPAPTPIPTPAPTLRPTVVTTASPTPAPTPIPTPAPTAVTTPAPTPAPTAAPTPAPTPVPTPAPTPAPTPRPTPTPTPAPSPLAQLPPAQQAAVAQLLQEIFQAPEADLLEMFAELSEQREKKRKERGIADLLKSRKA